MAVVCKRGGSRFSCSLRTPLHADLAIVLAIARNAARVWGCRCSKEVALMRVIRDSRMVGGLLVLCGAGCEETVRTESVLIPDSSTSTQVDPMTADGATPVEDSSTPTETPCLAPYMCRALPVAGADQNGRPVTGGSCSMGGLIPCDDGNPAASCAGFTDPICVHLNFSGMNLVTCGQRCSL